MKTTTDLRHIYPEISATLTDGDGLAHALDGHDIPGDSLTFKSGTSASGTFEVGGAVISSATFALMNPDGRFSAMNWTNSRVAFTLNCAGTAVDMGEYYIVSHSESGGAVSVTAFDALKILDSYEIYELGITYPTTLGALASAIASAHGMTVSGIRNPGLAIEDPGNDKMTQRACMSYLAQMCGQYVQARRSALLFGWYDLSSPYPDGNTFGHDWGTKDVTVTGVRVSDKDSSSPQDRGTDGYRIEITGNPFITSANVTTVADIIWGAVNGISFRAGSAEILASPAFDAGDVVTVSTPDEQNVRLILTNITYAPDVSMAITSDADAQAGDLVLNKSPYVKKEEAQQTVDDTIADQLSDADSDLSKAIKKAGGGVVIRMLERWLDLPPYGASGASLHCIRTMSSGSGFTASRITANSTTSYSIYIPEQLVSLPGISSDTKAYDFAIPLRARVCRTVNGARAFVSYTGALTMAGRWVDENMIALTLATGWSDYDNPRLRGFDTESLFGEWDVVFNAGYVSGTTFTRYASITGTDRTGYAFSTQSS